MSGLRTKFHYLRGHPAFRKSPLRTLGRLLFWRVRCWLNVPAQIALPRWQAQFYLPARWGGAGTTMIFATRENYEVELGFLDRFISSGSVAIDAGANCGIYTVAMAKLVGSSGRVIALEPGEQAGETLQRNIELNGLDHVRLYRKALSDRDGSARLYHHGGPVGYSIAAGETEDGQSEEISSISLDSLLQQEGLDRVDLLKMDIEGAEELALRGAETMLTASRPVIIFELNPSAAARFGLDTDGAWRHLQRFDYEFFIFDGVGKLCKRQSPPPEEQWEHCNIIAIPKDDHRSE